MFEKKVENMIALTVLILMFSFLFSSCSDDPPTKHEAASGLNTVGGFYYKAVMGTTNNIQFSYGTSSNDAIAGSWVQFSLLLGDGTLVVDSAQTNVDGIAVCQYNFNGNLGHAEIQALVRNVDTTTVTVRANTLIPGVSGQGQYILLDDWYSDVKNFNGTPDCVDVDPDDWFLYAVYESTLGIVFYLADADSNEVASDSDQVISIIVNSVYTGKTSDSIGIGSTLGEITTVYGAIGDELYEGAGVVVNCGDTISIAPDWRYQLPFEGLTFYTDTTSNYVDRVLFEMHLTENVATPPISAKGWGSNALSSSDKVANKRGRK